MLMKTANMITRTVIRLVKLTAMSVILISMASGLVSSRTPTILESVLAAGEIRMISRNGPTTYYEGPNGYRGFEYALAKRFAKSLGVKLVIHDVEDLGLMLDHVAGHDMHFAAAGLTITDKRQEKVLFSAPYMDVSQQVIYQAGTPRPKTVDDLIGKQIVIIGNSSHSENLRRLQRQHPELAWQERHDVEMLDLLELVHNGEVDITIVDSNAYEMSEALYPRARVAFDIKHTEQVAWAFPHTRDLSLYIKAQNFFAEVKTAGVVNEIKERYYGHVGELDYAGAILFTHRLNTRLPKWEELLKGAALRYDLDWQLLAALSYQESHWNPKAKSPTGVRGFMMLTRNTAKDLGIKNRLNAEKSIDGGARYFRSIYDRIPDRIADPDRTWLALAAYNVGFGHLEDARILTEHHGGNPDKWTDVRENLLLLSKRKYYKFTKHGYARGWEAVDYVQNIRNFHAIIAWNEKEKLQLIAEKEAQKPKFAQLSPVMTEAVNTIVMPGLAL